MEIIQEIGSYAGFAAVVGLAVLSALYFSQARDVKRLREWAGRAPERVAEAEAGGRPAAQPVPGRATPAPGAAQPVAKPAGGAAGTGAAVGAGAAAGGAAAAGAAADAGDGDAEKKPAPAKPVPAGATASAGKTGDEDGKAAEGEAAEDEAAEGEAAEGEAAAAEKEPAVAAAADADGEDRAAAPAAATPAGAAASSGTPAVASAAGAAAASASERGSAEGAGTGTAAPPRRFGDGEGAEPRRDTQTGVKVLPAERAMAPVRRPPTLPRTGQTAVLGGPPGSRPGDRTGSRWPAPRYIALIVAGVVILGLGGVVGVTRLTEEDKTEEPASNPPETDVGDPTRAPDKPDAVRINPADVTVAVLNATNTTGLASRIASRLQSNGFQLGNITNAAQRQRPESVVMFKDDANEEARAVARRLGIGSIEPIDQASLGLAGNAQVVVVLGADKSQQ